MHVRDSKTPQMRLSTTAERGIVAVTFLNRTVELTPAEAREFMRECRHSIALAEYARPEVCA